MFPIGTILLSPYICIMSGNGYTHIFVLSDTTCCNQLIIHNTSITYLLVSVVAS